MHVCVCVYVFVFSYLSWSLTDLGEISNLLNLKIDLLSNLVPAAGSVKNNHLLTYSYLASSIFVLLQMIY